MKMEILILNNLLKDEEYLRKTIPFIRDEYFIDSSERRIFKAIKDFVDEYNTSPAKSALEITFQADKNLTEDEYEKIVGIMNEFDDSVVNKNWLVNETEKFCKDKAIYNAILRSIQIIDGKDKQLSNEAIPELLKDALGVSFDSSVGHDYLEDHESRFEFYNKVEERIPFDLDMFNKITKGGLPNKTLNVALAGTGAGKTLFMCHVAASALSQGKNVLYVTMEMAEEKIAERIDANLLNVPIDELANLPKQMFSGRISKVKNKTEGKLIIKEYPTASAHAGHFRALLNELALKKEFVPDLIFIDYLNICTSSRFKMSNSVNTYVLIKGIAEELRGLAVEFNVPIITATQTTRSGYSNSDVELTDTSESFGLPATADFMFALVTNEELEKLNQVMVKQLKSRYNDPSINKRFVLGVDKSKIRLYDLEPDAQNTIQKDPVEIEREDGFNLNGLRRTMDISSIRNY